MKRLVSLLVLLCVFGAVACSSDSSDESAEVADGSDSVEERNGRPDVQRWVGEVSEEDRDGIFQKILSL